MRNIQQTQLNSWICEYTNPLIANYKRRSILNLQTDNPTCIANHTTLVHVNVASPIAKPFE